MPSLQVATWCNRMVANQQCCHSTAQADKQLNNYYDQSLKKQLVS